MSNAEYQWLGQNKQQSNWFFAFVVHIHAPRNRNFSGISQNSSFLGLWFRQWWVNGTHLACLTGISLEVTPKQEAGYGHEVEEVKTDTRKMGVRVSIKSNFSSVKTQPIANAGHSRSIKTPWTWEPKHFDFSSGCTPEVWVPYPESV